VSNVAIIGSGFSGLAAACFLSQEGHDTSIFEKNTTVGGRARQYADCGFTFDMGPSWYWMPDVFEDFFAHFGKKTSDYYDLVQLDPGFQIIFGKNDVLTVPANEIELYDVFEKIENGSSIQLKQFLKEAAFKYDIGMRQLVYKPAFSWFEYARWDVVKGVADANIFSSVRSYVRRYFKDKRLISLMEFPVLFLGAMPNQIPALYTMMNHAALSLGTWYPMGGMYKIIDAMNDLALSLGVSIYTDATVDKIDVLGSRATSLQTSIGTIKTDAIIASADYHHVEEHLLEQQYRNYNEQYWAKKTFAPSCLIFYVGVKKRIKNLLHHNLFFDADFDQHAKDIYEKPTWSERPLFYVCCPSKTDNSVAPEGMENLFILVPIASGLEDTQYIRESYFDGLIKRIEEQSGALFSEDIIYKKSYCVSDFVTDYNAYKGNAYGLANTLMQTAKFKPSLRNSKVKNLYYTGQLTVPGPGVPPSLISGQIAAKELIKYFKTKTHETFI
jgi:phytoene desaturase